MFRQTKRKPKNREALRRKDDDEEEGDDGKGFVAEVTTKSNSAQTNENKNMDDGDDEEDSPVFIRRRKEPKSFISQKKRKQSAQSLKRGAYSLGRSSSTVDDDGDNDGDDDNEAEDDQENGDEERRKKSKKRKRKEKEKRQRKGIGFGGMTMVIDEDGDDMVGMKEVGPSSNFTAPAYGEEALHELRAAQSTEKPKELLEEKNPTVSEKDIKSAEAAFDDPTAATTEENFISFHEPSEIVDPSSVPLMDEETNEPIILEDPDDNNWEEQIARRAGIQPANATKKTSSRPPVNAPTLKVLRENLQEAARHLSTREEDFENVIMRRESDLAQTKADRIRQQKSIEQSGNACGDYQKLRYELAMWVGALRDLEEKVEPIQKALLEMVTYQFETAHQEWVHWQDDTCVTLRECHRLDRVLGRPPPETSAEETQTQLDEFGRDIGSQIRRDRENRFRRREQRAKNLLHGSKDSSEVGILDYLWAKELPTERRYDILQEALRVALDDLDDDYSNPTKLEGVFSKWREDYRDEYRQCYANLSLADLGHVFNEVALCRAGCIRDLLKNGENMQSSDYLFQTALTIPQDEDNVDTSSGAAMERAFNKKFVPFILELLRDSPSVLFLSSELSQLFSDSLSALVGKMGADSVSSRSLCSSISTTAMSTLHSISIPILKPVKGDAATVPPTLSEERVEDSLSFAGRELPRFLQGLVLNLLQIWLPMLQKASLLEYQNLGCDVLAFLSETYLYFLSSLSGSQAAAAHLAPIWKSLASAHKDWLESPEFILQSAPLRAAARAYGLSNE